MAAEKNNRTNYSSAKYENLHGQLHDLIMDMQEELADISVRLEELRAMVVLAEAHKGSEEGVEYDPQQLEELRRMIDRVAEISARRTASHAAPAKETDAGEKLPAQQERSGKKKSIVGNIIFYGILVAFVLGVFIFSMGRGEGVKTFMGHSAFIVKTSSMESVYPRGSLVVTKAVDPQWLQVGDDITFMVNQNTTVTHRIITIHEKYGDTDGRGFETQGVMNAEPDKNIVLESNVVGKVIYCSVLIGTAAAFVTDTWPILIFSIAVLAGLSMVLENIFKEDKDGAESGKKKGKKPGKKSKCRKDDEDFFDMDDDFDDLDDDYDDDDDDDDGDIRLFD